MSSWLLLLTLLWGTACDDSPMVSLSALQGMQSIHSVVLRGADAPPSCHATMDGGVTDRWPASGRFWTPIQFLAAGAQQVSPLLTVRAPGASRVCVHWPLGGRYEATCREPGAGPGLTLRFVVPSTLEEGRPVWVGAEGTLFGPPELRVGMPPAVERRELLLELGYGVYLGLLFAIAIMSLVGFHVRRLPSYGWFAAFLVAFGAVIAGFSGRGLALFGGIPSEWLAKGPLLAVLLAAFLLVGFVRSSLKRERPEPDPWRAVTTGLMALILVAVAPVLVLGGAMVRPLAILTALVFIVLLTHLVRLTLKGSPRGRHLAASLAVLGLGVLLGAAHVLTGAYAGGELALSLVFGGALLMPIVLTLGLYEEIIFARRGRDQARGELLATQRLALLRALYCRVTGLPRRQKLAEMYENLVASCGETGGVSGIAVFLVQIDNLPAIRQQHGREALETMMIRLAGRLREGLDEDQVVGRLEDWDLAVLLPLEGVEPAGVSARVREAGARILACIGDPVDWRGERIAPLASIGAALSPEHGDAFGDLLRRCDSALFDAQAEGGKRVRIYSERRYLERADRWSRLEELGEALHGGNLRMVYQPIHRAADGALLGVEALVRWHRPDGVVVLPGEFMPLAEESDLILDIGYWIATTAIEDLAWLDDQGAEPLFLSLNVSPRQLVGDVFVTQISTLLAHAGIAPSRLHMEITENRLVEGLERTRRLLARMGGAGLKVYVDDFGVGYSSLSYLRELPIHGLKIDRSFVRNIGRAAQDETVLATVLRLAHGLRLDIIAEGIETERQARFLARGGCQALQGHYFAEAMSRESLLDYLNARRPTAVSA